MTTKKQANANRRNAKKSTGPKTEKGKAVSKFNAVRHGLLGQRVLLPDEDPDAFNEFYDSLMAELAPVGAIETRLADRVVANLWRLQRVGAIEVGIFLVREEQFEKAQHKSWGPSRIPRHLRSEVARVLEKDEVDLKDADYDRYEKLVDPVKRHHRVLGHGFVDDVAYGDTLSKLLRYETGLERSIYRALAELKDRQVARASGDAATPVVVDGTVDEDPETST